MSHGLNLIHNAIDRVFLPRSPVPWRFLGSHLIFDGRTCFEWQNSLHAMATSFSGCSYLALQPNYNVFDKPG